MLIERLWGEHLILNETDGQGAYNTDQEKYLDNR